MRHVYGIDFGTSQSAIMVGCQDGTVTTVKDPASPYGYPSIPTSVCLLADGTFAVGRAAEDARYGRPGCFAAEFKRDFGSRHGRILGGHSWRPDQLAVPVLAFLREQAALVAPGPPDAVVITVPASWERRNQDRMRGAAERAGLDPSTVFVEAEPVAAAGQVFERFTEVGNALIYDLGGGTFDCAVARRTGDRFEVLGTPGGLPDVGGATFDGLLLQRVRRAFPTEWDRLVADEQDDAQRRRFGLLDACRDLKVLMSAVRNHQKFLPDLGPNVSFTLTREELAELVRPDLLRTVAECERLLGQLGLGWADIERLVPIGASTRMASVRELLSERSGRTVLVIDEPDLVVVRGAVALAAQRAGWDDTPENFSTETDSVPSPGKAPSAAAAEAEPHRTAFTPVWRPDLSPSDPDPA